MRRSLVLFALLLGGCSLLPAPTPMARTMDRWQGGARARCLVVLLPGAGDHASTFQEEGFVAAIRGSGVSADIVAADATLGYYYRGVAARRIEEDVIGPLRAGYEQVWLMGVSMGGFGALHYAQQHVDEVDAVAVFAPYLGKRKLGEEIQNAGGLARWTPDAPAPITKHNYQRQLWSWLQRVTAGAPGPTIYLGYGDDDRLAPQDAILAGALPPARVFHAKGGHDWPVWRELLREFLARSEFMARCAASRPGRPPA